MSIETKDYDAGGVEIRLKQLKPRKAFKTFARACAAFSEQLIGLVANNMIKGTDGMQTVDDSVVMGFAAMAIGKADPESIMDLADDLLLGVCSVKIDGDWMHIAEGAAGRTQMDDIFPDVKSLLVATRHAINLNFSPILPGGGIDPSSTTRSPPGESTPTT